MNIISGSAGDDALSPSSPQSLATRWRLLEALELPAPRLSFSPSLEGGREVPLPSVAESAFRGAEYPSAHVDVQAARHGLRTQPAAG